MTIYNDINIEYAKVDFFERGLPSYMWSGVEKWLRYGVQPGNFLSSVISNNLKMSFIHADGTNQIMMYTWVQFFYNTIDGRAWGHDALTTWPKLVEAAESKGSDPDETQSMGKST